MNNSFPQHFGYNHDEKSAITAETPPRPSSDDYRRQVDNVAEKFEALFIRIMLSQMRKTTRELSGENSVFSTPIHNDMIEFSDIAVADQLAKQRLFGIASTVVKQLLPDDAKAGNIHIKNTEVAVASVLQQDKKIGAGLAAFATPLYSPNRR